MATELATAPPQQPQRQLTIRDRLKDAGMVAELAKALPKHCNPDRFARVALTALTRTPKLAECDQASFFRCLLDLSQWGLEPDGRRAHLIPFENRKRGVVECQLILDYKGLVELAYRSGIVRNIHADVVRDGDIFVFETGRVVRHVPHFLRRDADKPPKAGEVYAVYCFVELDGGATKTEVLSFEEVDSIRRRSRAATNGPWVTDWNEMAKKTAFRRVSKWLPLSAEIRDALDRDDDVLEGTAQPVAATPVQTVADLSLLLAGQVEDTHDRPQAAEEVDHEAVQRAVETFAGAKDTVAVQYDLDAIRGLGLNQPTLTAIEAAAAERVKALAEPARPTKQKELVK